MNVLGRLSIKQLRAFVSVYQRGQLKAAATELGVTPSAVSVLTSQIESTLDITLFDRTTRSLEPTRAAHEIIGIAMRILQDLETLAVSAKELNTGTHGSVHLAATPTTAMAFLPDVVRSFNKAYGNIDLKIDDCAPNQFSPLIRSNQVEFGIGTPPNRSHEFNSVPLVDDELCVVCAPDHKFAKRKVVTWKDINGESLINLRPGYGVRQLIDKTAAQVGVEFETVAEAGFLDTVVWMASSGLGIGILPITLARFHAFRSISIIQLVEPQVRRPISVITKKGRSLSPACSLFINVLTEQYSTAVSTNNSDSA